VAQATKQAFHRFLGLFPWFELVFYFPAHRCYIFLFYLIICALWNVWKEQEQRSRGSVVHVFVDRRVLVFGFLLTCFDVRQLN
jgi:hypothetical protein